MSALVIDSSAILATYFNELTASWVSSRIAAADRVVMSTVNLAETLMRIRDKQPGKADVLERRLLASAIEFIPPDSTQVTLAARARFLFPLNLGDCFAYALAKSASVPLLTLDRDFRSTDIEVLLPPAS